MIARPLARHGDRTTDRRAVRRSAGGFSLVELLIVMALIGILATMAVPQLLQAFERSRQRRTMADMRSIAAANGTYRVDSGTYATALGDLTPDYMDPVPSVDGWGNGMTYTGARAAYTLTSLGLDGASGPAPPSPWNDEPFEADLVISNGTFTQAPNAQ